MHDDLYGDRVSSETVSSILVESVPTAYPRDDRTVDHQNTYAVIAVRSNKDASGLGRDLGERLRDLIVARPLCVILF
jgi:hypothetical protein